MLRTTGSADEVASASKRITLTGSSKISCSQISKVSRNQIVGDSDDSFNGRHSHRFRTKRQYWAYSGLAVETKSSDDYEVVNGRIRRKHKAPLTRGLNRNYSRRLKRVYKGAAQNAKHHRLFSPYYGALLKKDCGPRLRI